jgi:hypothetical protein
LYWRLIRHARRALHDQPRFSSGRKSIRYFLKPAFFTFCPAQRQLTHSFSIPHSSSGAVCGVECSLSLLSGLLVRYAFDLRNEGPHHLYAVRRRRAACISYLRTVLFYGMLIITPAVAFVHAPNAHRDVAPIETDQKNQIYQHHQSLLLSFTAATALAGI